MIPSHILGPLMNSTSKTPSLAQNIAAIHAKAISVRNAQLAPQNDCIRDFIITECENAARSASRASYVEFNINKLYEPGCQLYKTFVRDYPGTKLPNIVEKIEICRLAIWQLSNEPYGFSCTWIEAENNHEPTYFRVGWY